MFAKRRMKQAMKVILPILGIMIMTAIALVFLWWETSGRSQYVYKPVVVLREDVQRGERITMEMLATTQIDTTAAIHSVIVDPNEIVGKEAKHFIPRLSQLHPKYFEDPGLVTNEDTFIMKIPNDWIYSVPDTLRRKDKVVFFEVTKDVINSTDTKKIVIDPDAGSPTNGNNIIPTYKAADRSIEALSKYPIYKTVVAYVKDGANREVVTTSYEERIDGSSVIRDIEIPVTAEDKIRLEEAVARGSKFIIAYREGD